MFSNDILIMYRLNRSFCSAATQIPNTAIRRARPVGRGIPADAWPVVFPEMRANSGDLSARSYTGDSSPGHRAATGDRSDAARPSGSAAPTAPRGGGSAPGGRRAGRDFRDSEAGDEGYTAGKGQQDQIVPVNHGRFL